MPTHSVTAQQLEGWLARLSDKWSTISVDANSPDGHALYQLVRRGLAEIVSRFIVWSPESSFEIWIEATIIGRWTQVKLPSVVKDQFSKGHPVGVYQHLYMAARMPTVLKFAVPEGEIKGTIFSGKPFALTGKMVQQLSPIDAGVSFAESYKRVPRITIFYSRAMFTDGARRPLPADSIVSVQLVQGACPSGGMMAWNIAEVEAIEGIHKHFLSSSAISFAFTQASFACSEAMHDLLEKGRRGDISETDKVDRRLGDACARMHHAGRYVIAMYQRHGRDPAYIAAMVANPLSVRNVDHGLLHEIETIAAMDSALGNPPRLPNSSSVLALTTGADGPIDNPIGEPRHAEILKMIRYMGRAFETTPKTYAKFSEEELRDHILTYLNGHFNGGASAEQFRKHGKTDLCIPLSDGEAFVTECKIWEGPSECACAVDQIMSYVTPRDRAGALIFFNKSSKNFTSKVVKAAADVIRANKLYLAEHNMPDFGEHHFDVHQKDDRDRKYNLHVLLFNLYPNPRESMSAKKTGQGS